MRTIIQIPEDQLQNLSYVCESQHISRAEAIRRAISLYLKETLIAKGDVAFGLLKDHQIDSIKYQTKIRDEWE